MAELSDLQQKALIALDALGGSASHSAIAHQVERVHGRFPLITTHGRGNGRGRGHRVMNQAQRFIQPIIGLQRRGLVRMAPGYEYALTEEGEAKVKELKS